MLKGARPGELLPATTRILELVTELEADIAKFAEPRWLAVNGPRLQGIKAANIYYYRDTKAVEPFTKMPKGDDPSYVAAADAYLQLAATCLKIAIDYQAADARDRKLFQRMMNSEKPELALVGAEDTSEHFNTSEDDEAVE